MHIEASFGFLGNQFRGLVNQNPEFVKRALRRSLQYLPSHYKYLNSNVHESIFNTFMSVGTYQ